MSGLIAISCALTLMSGGSPKTEIYVLDDAAKTVARWVPGIGAVDNVCERRCSVSYGPLAVTMNLADGSYGLVVNRQTGKLMETTGEESRQGQCVKTAMPHADVSKAKF